MYAEMQNLIMIWGIQSYHVVVRNNSINPLNPHDALKHHFTSLKADLISQQLGVLEWKFP